MANEHEDKGTNSITRSPKNVQLMNNLLSMEFDQENTTFIMENGEKYFGNVRIFAKKLGVSLEKAQMALDVLMSSRKYTLTEENIIAIDECLEDPDFKNVEEIALFCGITQKLVTDHIKSKKLSETQKDSIRKLFNTGYYISTIATELKLPNSKVQEYVDNTFITFSGNEGQKILNIIHNLENFDNYSSVKLRELIKSRDLKLQDRLYYYLRKHNLNEHQQLVNYFRKFDESRNFFEIDETLSFEDILFIEKENRFNSEELSIKLNKVETVVKEHLQRYHPTQVERDYSAYLQKEQIAEIVSKFGKEIKGFHSYRTIITESFDNLIERAEILGNNPMQAFKELLPLIFYYLKCSLSFENITRILAKVTKITLTRYDVFHMIFQLSDPVVRGLCIEHFSFSNPVPLYYPIMQSSLVEGKPVEFGLCSELWYSIKEYHGLISFGLGRASWQPIGKSHLLDLTFETDFSEGNPQTSAFHLKSVDIQVTKNFFGKSTEEPAKWAYIDCHRYSDPRIIKVICQHLEIALIHVSHSDFKENESQLTKEIQLFERCMKHVYIFIRDYEGSEETVQKENESITKVFLPNLTKGDMTVYSTLKKIGYEIINYTTVNPKQIGPEFIESVTGALKPWYLKEIVIDKKLIQSIMEYIKTHPMSLREINFAFLSYYPSFVKYMNYYRQVSFESDLKIIDNLNSQCVKQKENLERSKMGEIVLCFNKILERNNSSLVLWKLSQELSALTNHVLHPNMRNNKERYSIEIIWREALLTSKYGEKSKNNKNESFKQSYSRNFSHYVEKGDAFELIDGDNLRFFNKDINSLLNILYRKQIEMQQTPTVVSIFGPQSSGKSTLLNYCFGCKFLTSAGRCTKGVYASIAKLSQLVNNTNQFLILDTEGLDGGNKEGPSIIHFDRTMVLFCLAVSQVIIINIKGELGEEMQNLLQICAYSLVKLKVSKVPAPKIFFVLNQQADPDRNVYVGALKNLIKKLDEESELMDLDGCRISELIQISEDTLFILPSAFNSVQLNNHAAKLYESDVIKLYPTISFANRCAELKQSIVNQLVHITKKERTSFRTMSEWLEMSGVIWETIIKYQDIVKYRNVDELKCSNLLRLIVGNIMNSHMFIHQREFNTTAEKLISEIKEVTTTRSPNIILTETILKFNEVFEKYGEKCLVEFNKKCDNDPLLKRMTHLCEDMKLNLARLIGIEKKKFQDKFKFHIKAVLVEIKLGEKMERFQEEISENVDNYVDLNIEEQKEAFEELWIKCFDDKGKEEEEIERYGEFNDLYMVFKMESKTIENKKQILKIFRDLNFEMDKVIEFLRSEILKSFESDSHSFSASDDFIYPWKLNNIPIKEMTPFTGRMNYEYLGNDMLFTVDEITFDSTTLTPKICNWVPKCCHPLVNYCSGYFNHADITWEMEERKQIRLLASLLKDPKNGGMKTWEKLIQNISSRVGDLINEDPQLTQSTVKKLVNYLCSTFKHVNYEINFIEAKLTNAAERFITTFVFAYAFKSLWDTKVSSNVDCKEKEDYRKRQKFEYFSREIKTRKMTLGDWDRKGLRQNDKKTANQFALDFLDSLKRGVMTDQQCQIETIFNEQKSSLSHDRILLDIHELIDQQFDSDPDVEITNQNNFVIQFICNRSQVIKDEFQRKWYDLIEKNYSKGFECMKNIFDDKLRTVKIVFQTFLHNLHKRSPAHDTSKQMKFDSNKLFETGRKEILLKANLEYLRNYLNPKISQTEFAGFFENSILVDGIKVKILKTNMLPSEKPSDPVLEEDTFKKLTNTKMFNSEQIFNIYQYVKEFVSVLDSYQFGVDRSEFEEIILQTKREFESLALNCDHQCPSCGKFCDRKFHPHGGQCEIKTGHQICSMGGKVWENDKNRTAVLFTCEDYEDDTIVNIPGQKMSWGKFKEKTSLEWDWNPPSDETFSNLRKSNHDRIERVWYKFGRGILDHYTTEDFAITYITNSNEKDLFEISGLIQYRICFVIESTSAVFQRDINYTCMLIQSYKIFGKTSEFKIVFYGNHYDGNSVIKQFPLDCKFTTDCASLVDYLTKSSFEIRDSPKAILDGLATAITKSDWKCTPGVKNVIHHFLFSPPHGNFPNYKSHSGAISNGRDCCCCCSMCKFDWDRDVWALMQKFDISYKGISYHNLHPEFEKVMKSKLGELYDTKYWVKKRDTEKVDNSSGIFIDYTVID